MRKPELRFFLHFLPILTINITLLFHCPHKAFAERTPANYDFNLKMLDLFWPGESQEALEKQLKGTVISKGESVSVMKYELRHQKFVFPIFVQFFEGKVLDFYASLPSYFLHDIFHQSLIKKIGLQQKYFKAEETAIYQWPNYKFNTVIYSGTCTLTCFPRFLTAYTNRPPRKMEAYVPLVTKYMVTRP